MNLLAKRFTLLALLLTTIMVLFSGVRYCATAGSLKVQRSVIAESPQRHQQQPNTRTEAIQCSGTYWLVSQEEVAPARPPARLPLQPAAGYSFHPQDFYRLFFQPPR